MRNTQNAKLIYQLEDATLLTRARGDAPLLLL